ncbi:RibD family protein [Haloglycomyces albus]|uniref:RibD family protein n=1 Tax=Haloglycomyces albus TaxID=526067 RepID=UPI00046CE2C1|nr:dihydrofolate reductase family protein [Haloglycomyces albus]
MPRPFVILSAAMSLDGYLDDASDRRLLLSDAADFDRVDRLRATVDAILVGAETIRQDDPRLMVRSPERQQLRQLSGKSPNPVKVTVTRNGLDPHARFFALGESDKIVFTEADSFQRVDSRLGEVATVVNSGKRVDAEAICAYLDDHGVSRLLVEGGSGIHTEFLTAGLVDEMHVAVAPFFVGDSRAPRLVRDGRFAFGPDRPLEIVESRQVGSVALIRMVAPQ